MSERSFDPPTIEALCLTVPLYSEVNVDNDDCRELLGTMKLGNFQIDAHCLQCDRDSVFKTHRSHGGGAGMSSAPVDWQFLDFNIHFDLQCVRCLQKYLYWFALRDRKLRKAGQFPSMEDIAGADLNRFRSVLNKGDFSDLHRAGGLASHGIGIGSFVYLRRIFERLILKARDQVESKGDQLKDFDRLRMDEKIDALRSVLPPALVKNKATYGILSAGLHELNEDTCLKVFPVVRAAIIQMLDQDLSERSRKSAEEELEKEISKISADLRSSRE